MRIIHQEIFIQGKLYFQVYIMWSLSIIGRLVFEQIELNIFYHFDDVRVSLISYVLHSEIAFRNRRQTSDIQPIWEAINISIITPSRISEHGQSITGFFFD